MIFSSSINFLFIFHLSYQQNVTHITHFYWFISFGCQGDIVASKDNTGSVINCSILYLNLRCDCFTIESKSYRCRLFGNKTRPVPLHDAHLSLCLLPWLTFEPYQHLYMNRVKTVSEVYENMRKHHIWRVVVPVILPPAIGLLELPAEHNFNMHTPLG